MTAALWGPQSWATAIGRSLGKLVLVNEAGVGGQTSTQILSRFDTDVAPFDPDVVAILAMTNDVSSGFTMATSIANMKELVAKTLAIGAVPILATIPPRVAAYQPGTTTRNLWIKRYAAANGFLIVDYHAVLADPLTGEYKTGYSTDGVHPTALAVEVMATAFLSVVSPSLSPSSAMVADGGVDPSNAVTNGFLIAWPAEPVVPTIGISKAATGSSLPAGTYFYKVGYISAWGESLASNEVSIAAAAGDTITLSTPVLTGWQKLAIYRGASSGVLTKLADVASATTVADAGTATPGAITPPTVGAYTAPTGWASNLGAGVLRTAKVSDSDFKGFALQISGRLGTQAEIVHGSPLSATAGDLIAISFRVKSIAGGDVYRAQMEFLTATPAVLPNPAGLSDIAGAALGGGVVQFYAEIVAPSGVATARLKVTTNSTGSKFLVGEVSVINLTTQGVL